MSDSAEKEQPIYVIKKIIKGGGHHGGAWKVAYADFVTAMMALFMVLWLLSSSEKVQKAVGGYFQDPEGNGKLIGSQMAGAGGDTISVAKDDMEKLKDKLEEAMKSSPQFQKIKDQVKFIVTGEGLRIELLESDTGTFFESGSPVPTEKATEVLGRLAQEIGKLPNRIFIEGHTDARKFAGDYSNWELSSDRANTTRRVVQTYGVRADQVAQVRGFADQSLRDPEKPEDASNRRVSIIIQYLEPPKGEAKEEPAGGEGKPGEHGGKAEGHEGTAEGHGAKAEGHDAKPEGHDAKPDEHKAKPEEHAKPSGH